MVLIDILGTVVKAEAIEELSSCDDRSSGTEGEEAEEEAAD